MKKLVLLSAMAIFASCSTTSYYQVYETSSNGSSTLFEDANCKIVYDLWSHGGNAGFTILNKTEKPITLKLDESFFVLNDRAFDYYQRRTFTEGTDSQTVVSTLNNYYYFSLRQTKVAATSKSEVSYLENPTVTIPGNTLKSFSEYVIANGILEICNLKKYPTKKQIKSENYSENNSPYVFYNLIVYEHEGKKYSIKNDFYVSSVTNISEADAFEQKKVDECGRAKTIKVSKVAAPNKFYVKYYGN